MFAASSGRAGDFEQLGLAADEREVAAITTAERVPLELVLPDGSSGAHWRCRRRGRLWRPRRRAGGRTWICSVVMFRQWCSLLAP